MRKIYVTKIANSSFEENIIGILGDCNAATAQRFDDIALQERESSATRERWAAFFVMVRGTNVFMQF